MLEKLITRALNQRAMVLLGLALIVAVGIFSLLRLPIDAFPDMTNIQVEIVATAPGLSPIEIEKFVTNPMEMSMRGLPKLEEMRSVTKFGIAVVTLVFTDRTDIYFARQLVYQRLNEVEKKLPEGVECVMGPVATAMGEIYHYTLETDGVAAHGQPLSPAELTKRRTLQDWMVAPLLKSIPGVSEVNSFGGYVKQYQVIVDPDRLAQFDLSLPDVSEALAKNNENAGGGIVERHAEQFIVRGIGLLRTQEDILQVGLATRSGVPIRLGDVARVEIGQFARQGAAIKNARSETVGGIVMMLRGENSREVVRRVQEKVREINQSGVVPDNIRITPYYQRSEIIERSIHTVTEALIIGAFFVLIVLLLFLRSLRGALIVLLALPLSLLLTFAVMKPAGLEANLMSLGGLAISIGMIIDATIIQVENVQRRLSQPNNGCSKMRQVLDAVLEVRRPSIFGELIIAITFIPIISLRGMEGKMFVPLALTVALALLSSLLLSIFIIPTLCGLLLKPSIHRESPLMVLAHRLYLPQLRFALRHRLGVVLVLTLLLAVTVWTIPRLGSEFLPVMDEGAFDMDVQMLPGVSLEESLRTNRQIQERLMAFPELETLVGRTGASGIALEAKGVDKTGYTGALKLRKYWQSAKTREELFGKMRKRIESIPGMAFGFSQPIQCRIDELVAGTRAQLIVKLFGDDSVTLKAKAAEIAETLSSIQGTIDLVVEAVSGQPYITVAIDRQQAARYGIGVGEALAVFATAIGGRTATQIFEENRFFDCMIRFPEERRNTPEQIAALLIRGADGQRIPLGQIADIRVEEGPMQISREDGRRRIGIEVNVSGRDIGRYVAEAKRKIARRVSLPPGYYLGWGGQFENQQRASTRLAMIAPAAIGLILLLLFFTFNSLRLAMLVLLNLPFALIGGVIALYASGLYLSVPASIGFIVLFGVAVLNGVVLVSSITQLRQQGLPLEEAVSLGCKLRLRPVLMTAAISICSLIPMLFATGPGSEIQKPLATVVAGGLATSTFLTLILLPVFYTFFEKNQEIKCEE